MSPPLLVRTVPLALFLALAATTARGQELQPPPGWRVIRDSVAAPGDSVSLVMMPPGWHMTTGAAALVFDPQRTAAGRFTIESQVFLFPSTRDEGYGLFLGGRNLGTDSASYLAVLLRADGAVAVQQHRRGVTTMLRDWARHDSVAIRKADEPVKNVLRLDISPRQLTVAVNRAEVAKLSIAANSADGQFGFSLGASTNVHVSALDLTLHLAPQPVTP